MNFEKKNNAYKIFMTMIVTAIVTFIVTSLLFYNYYLRTGDGIAKALVTTETGDLDSRLKLIKAYIDKFYLGDIDEQKMLEMAEKGYVAGLGDEYTEYLTKDEYEELMIDVNGNYVGIGVYMSQDKEGNIIVLLPIKGSPAEEAGLKTGDIISKVDGEDCKNKELSVIANKIKGEEGTTVDLEIIRDKKAIKKTIKRTTVKINEVESKILENNIGYIQILSFNDGCSNEFELKLKELMDKGIKSLIIDVRDNGGGIVSEATKIAEFFVGKDNKIMIETNKEEKEEITKSNVDSKINSDMKVIILANENSASASEILIGALKDNNIAKVVGTKTYGKGVMQEVVPISTGGALKITIKEFITPNGNKINKEGIAPDEEIKEIKDNNIDEQLQKAIELCK